MTSFIGWLSCWAVVSLGGAGGAGSAGAASAGAAWVGVSPNIIDASFQALMDSIVFKLVKSGAPA